MRHQQARSHAETWPGDVSAYADIAAWPPQSDVTIRLARAWAARLRRSPALKRCITVTL